MNAKTIVVENNYTDKDYLDDFSAYYVRCHEQYKRRCTRLHFFKTKFSKNDFIQLLENVKSKTWQNNLLESYIGFMVIRPLHKTVIGRTCLSSYKDGSTGRYFPIVRPYRVNLFGIPLEVSSLAFQEQDQVVAACATSALWSAFQGTGVLFHHKILSPVAITRLASDNFPIETRAIPNEGLSPAQMAVVIRDVGLEPLLISVGSYFTLRSSILAYIEARIPLPFVIMLFNISHNPAKCVGRHAVVITGYHERVSKKRKGEVFRANLLDKIYVHDDGLGPFARMELDGISVTFNGVDYPSLSTTRKDERGNVGNIRAVPEFLLVPLYNKIRIKFEDVFKVVRDFMAMFPVWRNLGLVKEELLFKWELSLSNANIIKTSLFDMPSFRGSYARETLSALLPKYIWKASIATKESLLIEFLFDATSISHGRMFLRAIEYDSNFSHILRLLLRVTKNNLGGLPPRVRDIDEWLQENPVP